MTVDKCRGWKKESVEYISGLHRRSFVTAWRKYIYHLDWQYGQADHFQSTMQCYSVARFEPLEISELAIEVLLRLLALARSTLNDEGSQYTTKRLQARPYVVKLLLIRVSDPPILRCKLAVLSHATIVPDIP